MKLRQERHHRDVDGICRPDGAENCFGFGFYKDAAPDGALGGRDAENGHRDGRAPQQCPSWWPCANTGQWQFGVDERGNGRLSFSATDETQMEHRFSKPVRAGIFVDGHFKTNQAPFRSDIIRKGINAKAQRRREWWPSAKTFALRVLALNSYAVLSGLKFRRFLTA